MGQKLDVTRWGALPWRCAPQPRLEKLGAHGRYHALCAHRVGPAVAAHPARWRRSPNVTRCSPSRRRCSSPSKFKLYVAARPSPLDISMHTRQVRVSRAKTRTTHRADRPSHTHSLATPSVLPQIKLHRHDVDPTSSWRAERRGYRRGRLQGQRRGRGRASARAAACAVAV